MSCHHRLHHGSGIAKKLWKMRRAELFKRDQGVCAHCGIDTVRRNKPWEAHHLQEISTGGQDRLDNLVTLCRPCHQSWHDGTMRPNFPKWWVWWHEAQTGKRWQAAGARKKIVGLVRRILKKSQGDEP